MLPLLLAVGVGPSRVAALDPRRALTEYRSQSWGQDNGLPCNYFFCVRQTRDGYLWFGTEEGLVRFDAVRTKVLRGADQSARGRDFVIAIAEEDSGELIVGTNAGVYRLRGGSLVPCLPQTNRLYQNVRSFFRDADGTLWIGTAHGLLRLGTNGRIASPESAPGWPTQPVEAICRDQAGCLWVGTKEGLYRQRDRADGGGSGGFERSQALGNTSIHALVPARGGGLWVGTHVGVGRLQGADYQPRPELAGYDVTCLHEDAAGMLWAGTLGSGLFRLPGDAPGAAALTADNGLPANSITGLCEDHEGNLWITTTLGVQVLRDTRFVTVGRPQGLGNDIVRTVWQDSAGRLWLGTDNGLDRFDPADRSVRNFPLPPALRRPGDGAVYCLGSDDGLDGNGGEGVLAGTRAGILRSRDGKMEPLPMRDDLDARAVQALCLDAAGNRWVGTNGGLYQTRGTRVLARLTTAEGLASNSVRAIYPDRHGNLWVATAGGLSRRGPDGQITNFLSAGPGRPATGVFALFEDPADDGDLFAGSEFGLYRLRTAADGGVRVTRYTTYEGLLGDAAWSILSDGRGNLWMSSDQGISRVARADLDRFDRGEIAALPCVAYGVADGLRTRECNGGAQPVGWRDHAGQLWFATVKGAAVVDPARVTPNPLPPPVQIEELLADGRLVAGADANVTGNAPSRGGAPAPVGDTRSSPTLPAGTQRLEWRYTALSLCAPERNRFRYRLDPFDANWTEAGTERLAHYTNLPPGAYRFRVQAANADGIWNEQGALLAFRLRPHFYQTNWFRLLAAGLLGFLGWAGLRWHKRRLVRQLARAEADVRERTRTQEILRGAMETARQAQAEAERANAAKSEFLSRMSHELRTPLNAILGFGQLLEMSDLPASEQESVEHILGGGRHLLGLVNEVLDLARIESGMVSLSPEDLEVCPLLRETVDLVRPLARERGVELHLELGAGEEADPETPPPVVRADRQRLKQVLFNLLSNAVKYNRPTGGEVFVALHADPTSAPAGQTPAPNRWLRLSVRDTGIGIDPAELGRLFTPFERLQAAFGPIAGTGLGLAVSKQLVEAMGGRIGVESALDQGSTFWVELPAAEPPPEEVASSVQDNSHPVSSI